MSNHMTREINVPNLTSNKSPNETHQPLFSIHSLPEDVSKNEDKLRISELEIKVQQLESTTSEQASKMQEMLQMIENMAAKLNSLT
jgi:hypothetical protein